MPIFDYLFEIFIGLLVLSFIYFIYSHFIFKCNPNETLISSYNYSDFEGPQTWRHRFEVGEENQSPINIISVLAIVVPSDKVRKLDFTPDYHHCPTEMRLVNDGYTVAIYASWPFNKKPVICGGPLCDEYKLFCLRFRWGPNNEEGSEHMIDMRRYAMELQVTYNKCSCKCKDMAKSIKTCAVCIISYLFQVTPTDNPFLETVIYGLKHVGGPCKSVSIRPVPVSLLAPMFRRRFFTYVGSLTYPPCTEGVRWIVQPEPLTISNNQIRQFRELIGFHGYILSNTRPVQNTNNRDIVLFE